MRLEADNVSVARGSQIFFSGISFSLAAGEALIVSGPNGVGKSTFLRVLAGLLPNLDGSVALHDSPFASAAEGAHYLGHRNGMKAELTVRENLEFWRSFMAAPDAVRTKTDASVLEAIAMVGLDGIDYLPFGYLSAGQQRRIAMARLLTVHRPVWILDEPTAALDSRARDRFADLVSDHLASDGIVVAATHQDLGISGARELALVPGAQAQMGSRGPSLSEAPA
ncbi:MAG: heme ABC exporter ATP-binding protein CcmA [Pseudomonadota bacterium]